MVTITISFVLFSYILSDESTTVGEDKVDWLVIPAVVVDFWAIRMHDHPEGRHDSGATSDFLLAEWFHHVARA